MVADDVIIYTVGATPTAAYGSIHSKGQYAIMAEHRDSLVSEEILKCLAWKREVSKAKTLFEIMGQLPPPAKDFSQLKITAMGVVWRKWSISIRGVNHGTAPTPVPSEDVLTYQDFQYDDVIQGEIERAFGQAVIRQIGRILSGNHSDLNRLPDKFLVTVCQYLDLQSISNLSQVNSHMRDICRSDPVWLGLYRQQQGNPSYEVFSLAKELGWKKVFFMRKLDLQKELSRRRRVHSPQQQQSSGLPSQSLPTVLPQKS